MGNCGGKDKPDKKGSQPEGKGTGKKCDHCKKEFKSNEEFTILSGSNMKDAQLHHRCLEPYHRSLGHICTQCDGTITKELTTLKGDFGKATLHPNCVSKFRQAKGL
eukprot:TRINITY_DN24418_c0_g1_i1.p2 TRINITY_DN24418_c0_g1~~TRINITY_DN24418_c0_g1_i1.p2  ORF type:complete len:106 (+),score=43.99 TRINITY_DN24418_c0_g1_i1:60-377(+)